MFFSYFVTKRNDFSLFDDLVLALEEEEEKKREERQAGVVCLFYFYCFQPAWEKGRSIGSWCVLVGEQARRKRGDFDIPR